jgi:SagB-type dehydrogenase family enzyme
MPDSVNEAPSAPLEPQAIGALITATHRYFSHADLSPAVGFAGAVTGDLAEEFHEASKAHPSFAAQLLGPGGAYFTTVAGSAESVGRPSLAHTGPSRPLPAPAPLPADLLALSRRRRSGLPAHCATISGQELGTVLGLAAGSDPTRPGRRVHPSAGALYPIDLVAVVGAVEGIEAGSYVYDPHQHSLHRRADLDVARFHELAAMSDPVPATGVTIALVATFARTRAKYGLRGYRFALIEAGHLAQALITTATALGLCTLPWGGFFDREVDQALDLDGVERSCVYLLALSREAAA